MTSKKKQVLLGAGVGAVLIALLSGIKYIQFSAAMAEQGAFQPPPEAVTSAITKRVSWQRQLKAVGNLKAVQGTVLAAELAGTVSEIFFESGDYVESGKKLVQLDVRVEAARLNGARALAVQAKTLLARAELLKKKNANSQADLDAAIAQAAQTQAEVAALESTIAKKTIVAPFAAHTGIRRVNPGEYVTEGKEIVPLFSLDELYVEFDLPQKTLSEITAGAKVTVQSDELLAPVQGIVTSIDPNVNPKTRNFSVQALIKNTDRSLRPGMFVHVSIDTSQIDSVIPIPQSSIVYAPYGDSVWVIEDLKLDDGTVSKNVSQQFIKVGSTRGDMIAVLSGLDVGMEIVTSGGFKLRPGIMVVVNNDVTPNAAEQPDPPNT